MSSSSSSSSSSLSPFHCVIGSCTGSSPSSPPVSIIVEHLDEALGKWNCSEYGQIAYYLSQPSNLIITNINDQQFSEAVSLCHSSTRSFLSNARHTPKSVLDLTENNNNSTDNYFGCKPEEICHLDMNAAEELSPADIGKFRYIIVGGILGDHPPRDRGRHIRESGRFSVRKMGNRQMTSDTAALVGYLILSHRHTFSSLPFITDPDIETGEFDITTMPFRYLLDESKLSATEQKEREEERRLKNEGKKIEKKKKKQKQEYH